MILVRHTNKGDTVKAVQTPELKAGDFAAHVIDLPNCGGIQVSRQGTIEKIEAADMYGSPSYTQHLIYLRPVGGDEYSTMVITVHNSHTWLVRTR